MIRVAPLLLLFAACDCGGASLVVEGEHPYLRCLAMDVAEEEWESGGLRFTVDDRILDIEGEVPRALAFVATPGASFEGLPEAPLRVVLGGFARDPAAAEPQLRALAARGPALLLPGGEDDTEVFEAALDAVDDPALVDLRGLRLVRFGGHEWVPVPGAPNGRYARGERACGFSDEDLQALELPEAGGPRHLLSWAASTGAGPLARGFDGVGVGHAGLEALARRVGASGGMHGWPRRASAAMHAEEEATSIAVPVWGRIAVSPDGSWSRGEVATVELANGPLRLGR